MESLWWTSPKVRARFRQTPRASAGDEDCFAFNQGFYNLFLAVGNVCGTRAGFGWGRPRFRADTGELELPVHAWRGNRVGGVGTRRCGAVRSFKEQPRCSSCCSLWFTRRVDEGSMDGLECRRWQGDPPSQAAGTLPLLPVMIWLGAMGLSKGTFRPGLAARARLGACAPRPLAYLCAFISLACGVGLLWRAHRGRRGTRDVRVAHRVAAGPQTGPISSSRLRWCWLPGRSVRRA